MKIKLYYLQYIFFICLLFPVYAFAECLPINFSANNYEAGDRISELGDSPKVVVGQDGDVRYFTGEHLYISIPSDSMEIKQIEIIADFYEKKEPLTIQLLNSLDIQRESILQFGQDYQFLWVESGGKKKVRSGKYYKNKEANSYRFVFKSGTIRVFLNQEYIGSVEASPQISRLAINDLVEQDKIFTIRIEPVCDAVTEQKLLEQ